MDLEQWNQRLSTHFAGLRADRKKLGADAPLFALEHGLGTDEAEALRARLLAHIRVAHPVRDHALAWIVYAAEIGYGYAGDEYWQTFEAQTPGWAEHGDRGWIRDSYQEFHRQFTGAVPSGAWATQFSIICWPITHAILPRDLQHQLARILYELRHSFSAELFESPALLGQFIASRSWNSSARFQNLVQEPTLVGQIAAALLLQGNEGKTLLHPATLRRIGDDVDRERRGREWLRDARRAAEERVRVRGLKSGRPVTTPIERGEDVHAEVVALGIEPRLILRPVDTDGGQWDVSLQVPDLSHLLLRFPRVREVLTGSRCTVPASAGRPLARGRCLHGPQRVLLRRWPRSDEPLLEFERSEPQLDYLLRAECLLRPGPAWLFKIASDGLAYEARSVRVRAGGRYILLTSDRPRMRPGLAIPVTLTCDGVFGALLELPSALTPEWEDALGELGVTQAKLIEVWPAGLAAIAWDGEGHGEWLASERPTLAVRSDHPIDELIVSMGDGAPSLTLELAGTPPGEPIFIELPPLALGLHRLTIAARAGEGACAENIGDLDIVMRVREARPWSPGITPHGPLSVELEPTSPSLEQLWEGRLEVVVHGPPGRSIACRVSLFTRPEHAPSLERQLPPLTLPIDSDQWRRHFEKHLKALEEAQRAYDDARVCEVEFSVEELGVFIVRCEREFKPLRWSLRRLPSGFVARLHDDAGGDAALHVERYSFERPTVAERLLISNEYAASRAGGLYVARLGEFSATIIVPPLVRGLAELKCEPQLDVSDRAPESIVRLLGFARLWGFARLSGDLIAGVRRRLVLRALTAHLAAGLAGQAWASAESDLNNGVFELTTLKRSISSKPDEKAVGAKLHLEQDALAHSPPSGRVETLAALAASFRLVDVGHQRGEIREASSSSSPVELQGPVQGSAPDQVRWLAEFALRIASDPVCVEMWAGEHLEAGVKRLLELPTLARAARFLVVAVDQKIVACSDPREIYAGWRW